MPGGRLCQLPVLLRSLQPVLAALNAFLVPLSQHSPTLQEQFPQSMFAP